MYKLKTKKEAEEKLTQIIILMRATDIIELKQWAKTLDNYKTEILNHFDNRTTNGYTEGLNVRLKMGNASLLVLETLTFILEKRC